MIAHSSQADLSAVWWWWFFSGREDARIPRCIQSYAWVADLACKVNFHLWHLCISLSCFGWLVHPLFCSGFVAAPKVLLLFNLRFQSNGWVLAPAWKYRLKAVSTLCSIIYIYYIVDGTCVTLWQLRLALSQPKHLVVVGSMPSSCPKYRFLFFPSYPLSVDEILIIVIFSDVCST